MFALDRVTLGAKCRQYGALLKFLSADVDGPQLLWALAGNESSFGANTAPRHEAGYCRGGKHYDPYLTGLHGCWAHCSYGFSQLMFPNCPGFGVLELATDLDSQMHATVGLLQTPAFRGQPLDAIGKLWNGPKETEQYKQDLRKHYALRIPL